MNRVMEQLTSTAKAPKARQTDLREAPRNAVDRCQARTPVPSLDIDPDPIVLEADRAMDYVRTLGGRIDVSSETGIGTEFLISLPVPD